MYTFIQAIHLWAGLTCLQRDQTVLTDRHGAGPWYHICQCLHNTFDHLQTQSFKSVSFIQVSFIESCIVPTGWESMSKIYTSFADGRLRSSTNSKMWYQNHLTSFVLLISSQSYMLNPALALSCQMFECYLAACQNSHLFVFSSLSKPCSRNCLSVCHPPSPRRDVK